MSSKTITFNCRRFDPGLGRAVGILAPHCIFDGKLLDLRWTRIPLHEIDRATGGIPGVVRVIHNNNKNNKNNSHNNHHHKSNHHHHTNNNNHHHQKKSTFIQVTKSRLAQDLIKKINIAASERYASERKVRSVQTGTSFCCKTCPRCSSKLVLSDFAITPQVYCKYCETLSYGFDSKDLQQQQQQQQPPQQQQRKDAEADMHICSQCGLFAKPEPFSYNYITFLVFYYSVSPHHGMVCKNCEKEIARKVCLFNTMFLIGIPCAIRSRVEAQRNVQQDLDCDDSSYAKLNHANSLIVVRKGRQRRRRQQQQRHVDEGIQMYHEMLQERHINAGIRYNLGQAHMAKQDWHRAAVVLEDCLRENCSNYEPAALSLLYCYNNMEELLGDGIGDEGYNNKEKINHIRTLFELMDDDDDHDEQQHYRRSRRA